MLLQLDRVCKRIGDRVLFRNVSFHVRAGDRIGLVGPNGAGKTTLLRVLAGQETPDEGRVHRAGAARVGLLRQEPDPRRGHSAREEVAMGLAHLELLEREAEDLESRMAELGRSGREVPPDIAERYDQVRSRFHREGGFERDSVVDRVMGGLGFAPERRDQPIHALSGGWLVRVELAKLLLSQPEVLLLDEPTNHLDLPSIEWLEDTLDGYRGAVVAVSHDRLFLRHHVARIAELDQGRVRLFEGAYDHYQHEREALRAQHEARHRNQARRTREVERFAERFRAKASKARQVQSRLRMLERMEPLEAPARTAAPPRVRIPEPPRSGERVIQLRDVHKRYGDTVVYAGVDLEVRRGERVALAGPNGAGKSTLLRLLAGVFPPDAGSRRLGHNVRVAFYAQHALEMLDPHRTVLEELGHDARTEDVPRLRAHLGAFLFSGDDVEKRVSVLSGGEKTRLALAKLLLRPANCLCLDEPTNHLDVIAADAVEAALRSYSGTVILISHDRAFVNALATRIVEVESGSLGSFPGSYEDYRRARAVRSDAAAPPSTPTGPAHAAREERRRARDAQRTREREQRLDERELARVEEEIHACERSLEALRWRMAEPEVHRNGEQVRAADAERARLENEIGELYRRWEELAERLDSAGEPGRIDPRGPGG